MSPNKRCCFLAFDYLDFDVYLNTRTFYALAGFAPASSVKLASCDLLVVFRGIPHRVFPEFSGPIHFFDYVCQYRLELRDYFPNATSITIISIDRDQHRSTDDIHVYGYLPVIPSIWQFSFPFTRRSSLPIHVSNYKPLQEDPFQEDLLFLIKTGRIKVFGSKWERIQVKARPLSYLSANCILATASICYGLMYPYQRGRSLSGRMWQAPINGCFVITESNTNPFLCPGVFEVPSFGDLPSLEQLSSRELALQASKFWLDKTNLLARDLGLSLNWKNLPSEVVMARTLMLRQHLAFLFELYVIRIILVTKSNLLSLSHHFIRKIRFWRS